MRGMSTPNPKDTPSASECPACGAPLNLTNVAPDQMQVKCEYCGKLVNIPGKEKPVIHQTIVNVHTGDAIEEILSEVVPAARTAARVSTAGALIGVLITLVVIGGVLISVFSMFGSGFSSSFGGLSATGLPKQILNQNPFGNSAFNNPILIPQNNDQPQEMVSVMRDSDSQYYLIDTLLKDKKIKWKGAQAIKEYYTLKMMTGQGLLFTGDADKLAAYKLDTGASAWQVSLASAPPVSCPACQQTLGNSVVSFGRDGTLQGFNAADGKPLWSKRLDPFTGQPYAAQGRLVVGESISQTRPSAGLALLVLDPATGEAKQRIEPSCAAGGAKIAAYQRDRYFFSPDGNSLLVMYGGSDMQSNAAGCLQRYDLNTGKLAWSTLFKQGDGFPSSIASWVSALATNDAIYIIDDGTPTNATLLIVEAQTGKFRKFTLDAQYRYKMFDASADVVIVQASPRFDSSRYEYWGINPADGARTWQFVLDKAMRVDSSAARLFKDGLVVMQCGDNPDKSGSSTSMRCSFDRLDPKTGVSGGQVKVDAPGSSLGQRPRIGDDFVWILLHNKVLGLSLTDGKTIHDLP